MQRLSYNLHHLLYLASQHVLQLFQHVSSLSIMFYRFDDVGLAFLGQDMPKFVFVLKSMCLGAFQHAYALIYIFVCPLPCSCVQIYMLVAMPCASKAFHRLLCLFLMIWPFRQGADLDLVVQANIHTPRPISKGLGHFFYACVLVCFYALYPCLPIQIQALPCFFPPWVCACRSLGPLACVIASVPLVACLDLTVCEAHLHDVGVLDEHLSPLCAEMLCLPSLLCATYLAFFTFLHFYMLAYMFMHEFVCRPYSNPMELWTSNPNLHFSSQDTLFCLITCCLPLFGSL